MINPYIASIVEAQSPHEEDLLERFNRLVFTPLGSRVMLPHFGSLVHEDIDKTITPKRILKLRKNIFECFYDENYVLWDDDFSPAKISIEPGDVLSDVVTVVEFDNGVEIRYAS